MELAKWTFPIISLCREPYEAKVSRTGLTGGMGRRTVRQRALCLPSQAVYRGKEESKKPNGEGKQVSQRKGRRGTRDAKSRNDPERIERETGEPDDAKVSCPVRGGARRKGRKDLARSLPYSDTGFHAAEGDPANLKLCQRGEWQDRMLVETVLSMLTLVCHFKQVMHRGWAYFQARLAFTMAAFNVLVQWHGFQPYASGFVPLSIAEFSL